jgi:hypothetical protein
MSGKFRANGERRETLGNLRTVQTDPIALLLSGLNKIVEGNPHLGESPRLREEDRSSDQHQTLHPAQRVVNVGCGIVVR